jgi:hypothetical protein
MYVIINTIDVVPKNYLFILWQPDLFCGAISDLPQKFSTYSWIYIHMGLY